MKLTNKNKFIKILTAMVVMVGISVAGPSYSAAGDLVIEFESTPLFNEANFLPGNEITRYAKVTNNTGVSKDIIAEVINVSDPDNFADALTLVISEGDTELFNDSLADFFDAGEVALSEVSGGGSLKQYDFSIVFNSPSGNSYQENSLGFDILIGFAGDGGGGEEGGGGGGGGGGGESSRGLSILNETIQALDVETTSITIVWNTSYRSTSRVVYSTIPNTFDFNSTPNYGYSFSTVELDSPASSNGVLNHSVTITGLTPGTTYYFRTISHASPDSLSFEYSFTTLGEKNVGQQTGQGNIASGNSLVAGTSNSGISVVFAQEPENTEAVQSTPESTPTTFNEANAETENNGLLAFIGLDFLNSWLWILVILAVIIFLFILWRRSRNKNK